MLGRTSLVQHATTRGLTEWTDTRYDNDARANLAGVTAQDGNEWTYPHDAAGASDRLHRPGHGASHFTYDLLDQQVTPTDNLGRTPPHQLRRPRPPDGAASSRTRNWRSSSTSPTPSVIATQPETAPHTTLHPRHRRRVPAPQAQADRSLATRLIGRKPLITFVTYGELTKWTEIQGLRRLPPPPRPPHPRRRVTAV